MCLRGHGRILGVREEVILVTTYPHSHRIHVRRPQVTLSLVVIVVLAAALVGLGAWVAVDRLTGGGGATQDATTLIDKLYANISAGNADAAAALYTPDAIVWNAGGLFRTYSGMAEIRESLQGSNYYYTATRSAPVTVQGPFAATYFSSPQSKAPILIVFQLRDGKIFREWGFQLGTTKPFDTAKP